jgi:putative mRNA 3-end processing factor
MRPPVVRLTPAGLYVPAADLFIDPWGPAARAVITHGHADHARGTARAMLTAPTGVPILRTRLGMRPAIEALPWGERRPIGDAILSLHPAGHILGSAQVRIEVDGEVWVVTGDCKTQPDPSSEPFEPVACHTLISECTFGLPVYRWPDPSEVIDDILDWWRECATRGVTALLGVYALGKAQRILAHLATHPEAEALPGPILVHGAVDGLLPAYREATIPLPPTERALQESVRAAQGTALVLAPPSTAGKPWARKLEPLSLGVASGWMQVRGTRRRRGADRGFVLSDHLDWPALLAVVAESGASQVGLTHGATGAAARFLREERGLDTFEIPTYFSGEEGAEGIEGAEGSEGSDAPPADREGA